MAGRGSQTFKKRQKEQQRKEKQEMKFARRIQKKENPSGSQSFVIEPLSDEDLALAPESAVELRDGNSQTPSA